MKVISSIINIPHFKNQSIDLIRKAMDWFLYLWQIEFYEGFRDLDWQIRTRLFCYFGTGNKD